MFKNRLLTILIQQALMTASVALTALTALDFPQIVFWDQNSSNFQNFSIGRSILIYHWDASE